MGASMAGPGVAISLRAKYKTFTPDQFMAVFQQGGCTGTPVATRISGNPMAAQVPAAACSKDGLPVLFNDAEGLIKFHAMSRRDTGDAFDGEIKGMLWSLDCQPSAAGSVWLEMAAAVSGTGSTAKTLKSPARGRPAGRLEGLRPAGNVAATSLKFARSDDRHTEFLTTTIEPLISDPEGPHFASIEHATRGDEKFANCAAKLGDETVERAMRGVEDSG